MGTGWDQAKGVGLPSTPPGGCLLPGRREAGNTAEEGGSPKVSGYEGPRTGPGGSEHHPQRFPGRAHLAARTRGHGARAVRLRSQSRSLSISRKASRVTRTGAGAATAVKQVEIGPPAHCGFLSKAPAARQRDMRVRPSHKRSHATLGADSHATFMCAHIHVSINYTQRISPKTNKEKNSSKMVDRLNVKQGKIYRKKLNGRPNRGHDAKKEYHQQLCAENRKRGVFWGKYKTPRH